MNNCYKIKNENKKTFDSITNIFHRPMPVTSVLLQEDVILGDSLLHKYV
jgi:hypothetical protein